MRKLLVVNFLAIFLLVGCGVSDIEKQQIAAVTCSVMGETRNMDGAVRIKEMNAARVEIGEDPFLDGDEAIKEAFKYGLCEQLVKNDLNYTGLLSESKRLEQEAVAAQQQREREKKRRDAQIAEILRKENQKKWKTHMDAYMSQITFTPKLLSVSYSYGGENIEVKYRCSSSIEGLTTNYFVVLKNNSVYEGTYGNSTGNCGYNQINKFDVYSMDSNPLPDELYEYDNPIDYIDEIRIEVSGTYDGTLTNNIGRKKKRLLDSETHGLRYSAYLDEPYVWKIH